MADLSDQTSLDMRIYLHYTTKYFEIVNETKSLECHSFNFNDNTLNIMSDICYCSNEEIEDLLNFKNISLIQLPFNLFDRKRKTEV